MVEDRHFKANSTAELHEILHFHESFFGCLTLIKSKQVFQRGELVAS